VADPFLPDVVYHAARLNMRVNDRFQFYMGVDNIFDTEPPGGSLGISAGANTGVASGGDPYDAIGRYFYAGAQVDF
jgi:outer membrane receptor protein involved in Fe transport